MACPDHNPCNPCADCPPAPALNLPPCLGGEPCEEISKVDCITFSGPNLPALGILNNDRMLAVLLKLHRIVNGLISPTIPLANFTATNTDTTAPIDPLVVTYLGLGPVYTSTAGATSSGTTITVGSTTGLTVGMSVQVLSGNGVFAANTTVLSVPTATTFVVTAAPTTALSGTTNIIRATGSNHEIFTISVAAGTPQTFRAFVGSPVRVSGTGTIV